MNDPSLNSFQKGVQTTAALLAFKEGKEYLNTLMRLNFDYMNKGQLDFPAPLLTIELQNLVNAHQARGI